MHEWNSNPAPLSVRDSALPIRLPGITHTRGSFLLHLQSCSCNTPGKTAVYRTRVCHDGFPCVCVAGSHSIKDGDARSWSPERCAFRPPPPGPVVVDGLGLCVQLVIPFPDRGLELMTCRPVDSGSGQRVCVSVYLSTYSFIPSLDLPLLLLMYAYCHNLCVCTCVQFPCVRLCWFVLFRTRCRIPWTRVPRRNATIGVESARHATWPPTRRSRILRSGRRPIETRSWPRRRCFWMKWRPSEDTNTIDQHRTDSHSGPTGSACMHGYTMMSLCVCVCARDVIVCAYAVIVCVP